MQNRKTDTEKRALNMATAYAAICGAKVPEAVIHAAVNSGAIARTAKGNIDKRSFANFLERMGYIGAAASFRRKYGLKLDARDKMILGAVPEFDAEKIEVRSFTVTAGGHTNEK